MPVQTGCDGTGKMPLASICLPPAPLRGNMDFCEDWTSAGSGPIPPGQRVLTFKRESVKRKHLFSTLKTEITMDAHKKAGTARARARKDDESDDDC